MRSWSLVDDTWRHGDLADATVRWFDVDGPPDREAFEELALRYGLHPLAVEDCLSLNYHAPKLEDFGEHLFIVIQGFQTGEDGPEPVEFDTFLGNDFIITYSDVPVDVTGEVARALESGQSVRPGADGLFYEIFDRVVDDLLPLADALSTTLEEIQSEALETGNVSPQTNHLVLRIRARAGRMRRLLIPQTGIALRLGRGEVSCVSDENRPYFRDIYDHMIRTDGVLEEVREDAEVAINTYIGVWNNRLSQVMKVLSVVAALALPATVITGIFGTNFDDLPMLHRPWGFAAMMGGMAAISGSMFVFFRRRGWF